MRQGKSHAPQISRKAPATGAAGDGVRLAVDSADGRYVVELGGTTVVLEPGVKMRVDLLLGY